MSNDEPEGGGPAASHERVSSPPRWAWPLLAVVAPALAMVGALSNSNIFFARDASFIYWPQHRWYRQATLSGGSLLWDPYVAFGQSAVADPSRHIFFPPVIAARLLLPEVLGFNVSVAAAFPAAAFGTYLYLARHVSRQAAALGAIAFALSGPVLSTGNMMNNAWTLAAIPYVLWAVDRVAERGRACDVAVLAVAFAMQVCAGEPVTLAATAALGVAYAVSGAAPGREGWVQRMQATAKVIAGGAAGALLAAAQLFPLVEAQSRSLRAGASGVADSLPLHPLALVETVAYPIFGNPLGPISEPTPWLVALNGRGNPYLYSNFVGVGAVGLAIFCAFAARRRSWVAFWWATLAVATLCALGPHTPFYPALKQVIPLVPSFRYPSKFGYLAALAVAALAAGGWDQLGSGATPRARLVAATATGALAALALAALAAVALAPDATLSALTTLAANEGVAIPRAGAEALAAALRAQMPKLVAVAVAVSACIWLGSSTHARAPLLRWALFALVALDLFATNGALNPTASVDLFREPDWVATVREHPHDRVYLPGRLNWQLGGGYEEEFTSAMKLPPSTPVELVKSVINNVFASTPAPLRVREPVSIDQSLLWPRDYRRMIQIFALSQPDGRARYLTRTATRYFIDTSPPYEGAPALVHFEGFPRFSLYEGPPPLPRAFVATGYAVEPDADAQTAKLSAAAFDPATTVQLEREPPEPGGAAGEAGPPSAEFVVDAESRVVVRARAPEGGGFLVVHDTFDPGWSAEVDGTDAPVVRANGLFRAVRLAPGEHVVELTYSPRSFRYGCAASVATALVLLAVAVFGARRV